MTGATVTAGEAGEADRLAELHEYGLLDVPADAELEALLRVAAAVAGVPTATVNLIDADRQCQLTTVGFAGADSARDESMCAVSIALGGFVHVPDALTDPRFAASGWVDGRLASVRFYSAAPLVTPAGHALGTLCVFDVVPRRLTPQQIARLEDLAALVMGLFERRRQARYQEQLAVEAERARSEAADARCRLEGLNTELRRSNDELRALAAVASHDLKAPLAVVGGYLEQLDDTYGGALDDRGRRWVATAARATGRMRDLIDSLLRYAQAGATPIRLEPTDTEHVLRDVEADLGHALDAADARLDVTGPLPTLDVDPVLLRQLLQNLIANAVKFAHADRAPHIRVDARREHGGWTFRVADNGVGIPAERRGEVFTMFTRLDGTVAGHGIGLATCHRIVSRHGGHIRVVEPDERIGTTMEFTIPDTGG